MEQLIFGAVLLVHLALFIGAMLSPVFLAFLMGKRLPNPHLRWLLPFLVIFVPLVWGYASYRTFKENCKTLSPPVFFASPTDTVDGFFFLSNRPSYEQIPGFAHLSLPEPGSFQFVEKRWVNGIERKFLGQKDELRGHVPIKTEYVSAQSSKSEYAVIETPLERVEYWWRPPIHKHYLEVREKKTGRLLAEATDLVFGGGIAGPYMATLHGFNENYRFLSCGYASADPQPWRPRDDSLASDANYREADRKFLTRALSPAEPRPQQATRIEQASPPKPVRSGVKQEALKLTPFLVEDDRLTDRRVTGIRNQSAEQPGAKD